METMADEQAPGNATRTRPDSEARRARTGPWPSFVRELKRAAGSSPMAEQLLGVLELSYDDRVGHWKHGGVVGVRGYGAGVIGRYSDVPEQFPEVAQFHTMRVNHPAGWFYTTDALRTICDIWEKHGSGLTNLHGATGDIILLGTKTESLEPAFAELTENGFDLGGSGSVVRTPSCCVGPGALRVGLLRHAGADLRPHACTTRTRSTARRCPTSSRSRRRAARTTAWRRSPARTSASSAPGGTRSRWTRREVRAYAAAGVDVRADVCDRCPSKCMAWDGETLAIDNGACARCMHCINVMPKALRPGRERGACILIGGKAPIVSGAMLSSVLVPFMKLEPPYTELKDLIAKILELWARRGQEPRARRRVHPARRPRQLPRGHRPRADSPRW